jgi:hypothetical protein
MQTWVGLLLIFDAMIRFTLAYEAPGFHLPVLARFFVALVGIGFGVAVGIWGRPAGSPKPPSQGGGLTPLALLALLSAFLALPGCTPKQIAYARGWITAADLANGGAARLGSPKVKACVDEVVALADDGKVLEAEKRQAECTKMRNALGTTLEISVTATGVAAPAVDAAEAGDYLAALPAIGPVISAVKQLIEVYKEHGLRVPVQLPAEVK